MGSAPANQAREVRTAPVVTAMTLYTTLADMESRARARASQARDQASQGRATSRVKDPRRVERAGRAEDITTGTMKVTII